MNELTVSNDVLFSEDTTVIHISGNKENPGRILKVNQGLFKVFGYTKTEVIGHSLNVIMPKVFAVRHNEFLEKYFETGYSMVLNKERIFYGMHKDGSCFCLKTVVKQLPSLNEEIQYVGMLKGEQTDCEYIITDTLGIIDSCSSGITRWFNTPNNIFKEGNINIHILIPELLKILDPANKNKKGSSLNKYKEIGGRKLSFIIPKDLSFYAQVERRKSADMNRMIWRGGNQLAKRTKIPLYWEMNNTLNKKDQFNDRNIHYQKLTQSAEYKEFEITKTVMCEINEMAFGTAYKDIEPLKIKVFKVFGIPQNKGASDEETMSDNSITKFSGFNIEAKEDIIDNKDEATDSYKEEVKDINLKEPDLKVKTQERREDIKTTERIRDNLFTTEKHVETVEGSPLSKLKEEGKKHILIHRNNMPEVGASERKSIKKCKAGSSSSISSNEFKKPMKKFNTQSFKDEAERIGDCKTIDKQIYDKKEVKEEEGEELTPRIDLGQLRTPECHNSELPAFDESRAHSSVGTMFDRDMLKLSGHNKDKGTKSSHAHKEGSEQRGEVVNQLAINKVEYKTRWMAKCEDPIKAQTFSDAKSVLEKLEGRKINSIYKKDMDVSSNMPKNTMKSKEKHKDLHEAFKEKFSSKDIRDYFKEFKNKKKYKKRILKNYDEASVIEAEEGKVDEEEYKIRMSLLAHEKRKNEIERKNEANKKDAENEENKDEMELTFEKASENTPDTKSLATSSHGGSIMHSYYSLRAAIDEKFIPPFFRRMEQCANIVFIITLVIAIMAFTIKFFLYRNIKGNVYHIRTSKVRIQETIELCLSTYNLILLSTTITQWETNLENVFVDIDKHLAPVYFALIKKGLRKQGIALKEAQHDLNKQYKQFYKETFEIINPSNLKLKIWNGTSTSVEYVYSMWQAITEIVVSTLRVSEMGPLNISEIIDPTVYFITENGLNTILVNLDKSSKGIVDEINKKMNRHNKGFIALVVVASISIFICATPIFMVVRHINKNKEYTLELFMLIKKKYANDELKRCKRFLGTIHTQQDADFQNDDYQDDIDEDSNIKMEGQDPRLENSKRKSKRLIHKMAMEVLKLGLFILIVEAYFIIDYMLAYTFRDKLLSLVDEFDKLSSRFPENSLLYLAQKYF